MIFGPCPRCKKHKAFWVKQRMLYIPILKEYSKPELICYRCHKNINKLLAGMKHDTSKTV